jgi:FkbM family methyltransferase
MLTGCLFCERIPIGPEAGHFIHMNFNGPTNKTEGDYSLILDTFWLFTKYPHDIAITRELGLNAGWDPESCDAILHNVKPGDVCVNVGIDFGYFTEIMARLAGKNGKVISVSPVSEIIENYKKSTAKNDYTNTAPIELYIEALGNRELDVRFIYLEENPGASYIKKLGISHDVMGHGQFEVINMKTKPFKEIYQGDVDFAIVKASGYELEALQGFLRLPKTLVIEYVTPWASNEYVDFIFDNYEVRTNKEVPVFRNDDLLRSHLNTVLVCRLKDSII